MARQHDPGRYMTIYVAVQQWDVQASAGLSIELLGRFPTYPDEELPLYRYELAVVLHGHCIDPAERANERFEVTLQGRDRDGPERVKHFREREEDNSPRYRKVRGQHVPVYRIPPGMAVIERRRVDRVWTAWIPVAPRFPSDVLAMLNQGKRAFLTINELRLERRRWARGIWLGTKNPTEE